MNQIPGQPSEEARLRAKAKTKRLKRKLAIFRLSTFFCLILIVALAVWLGISTAKTSQQIRQMQEQLTQTQKNIEEKDQLLQDAKTQNETLVKQKEEAEKKLEEANKQIEGYQNAGIPYKGPKIAYLTFDDGVSKNTEKILEILAKYDVKATFFPNWKEGNEELYKKIADGGHALGNHTASHDWKSVYSSLDGFINEVETLNDKIEAATGTRPTLFRFPGGSNNTIHKNYNKNIISPAIDYLNQKGITYIDWNVDSGDASSQTPLAPEKLTKNVLDTALRQSVILMHDTNAKPTTVEALPAIIEGLKERGYKFDVLSPDSTDSKVQFIKS